MSHRSASRLLAAVTIAAAGCHIAYDGDLGPVHCEDLGAYGEPACPSGQTCLDGLCASLGAPLGFACLLDEECAQPARCLDPTWFGQTGDPSCSRMCCASTDCGDPAQGMVCWYPSGGTGGLCWRADELGRPPPGHGRPGDACADPSECRSSLCDGARCIDACCGDSFCPPDQLCRVNLTPVAEQPGFTCGLPAASSVVDYCNSDDDCKTAKCIAITDMVKVCAQPCCRSEPCGSKQIETELRPIGCAIVDGLRACAKVLPVSATHGLGAACQADEECRSGLCVDGPTGRYCSDTCCDDASCGDTSAFSCSPVGSGQDWFLQCVRK